VFACIRGEKEDFFGLSCVLVGWGGVGRCSVFLFGFGGDRWRCLGGWPGKGWVMAGFGASGGGGGGVRWVFGVMGRGVRVPFFPGLWFWLLRLSWGVLGK